MTIKDFEKVFLINLDRRGDRLAEAKTEMARVGCDFERVAAVDGRTLQGSFQVAIGHVGCSLSHLSVVKLAKERGYKSYVVVEDDVVFHPEINERFPQMWEEVPENWDMIFFGGSHVKGFTKITNSVIKMNGSYTTHAMIIRDTMYDRLIDIWQRLHASAEVDVALSKLHREFACYSFIPAMAWQRAGFSDILNHDDNYIHLMYDKDGNKPPAAQ